MRGGLGARLTAVAIVVGATAGAGADTYTWTGSENGFWTNANNWAEGAVPGRIVKEDGSKGGQTGDVAVFGNGLDGSRATTIDFSGVYSVLQILTTGTNQYTYGTAESQKVPIEPYGVFSAAETSETPAAIIPARLQLGVELMATNWGGETMIVRNNAVNEFVLGAWGDNTGAPNRGSMGEPSVRFEGSGDIRLSKPFVKNSWYMMVKAAMTGTLIVDAETTLRNFSTPALAGGGTQRIHITANGQIRPNACYNWLSVGRSTVMTGEGTFNFAAGQRSGAGVVAETALYAPISFLCPVGCVFYGDPPDGFLRRVFVNYGNQTATFGGGSTIQGVIHVGSTAVIASDSIGLRGTFGGMGDVDFLLANNATLRYTGAGETMDRTITLTNKTDLAGKACLDHAGTGPFVVRSAVGLQDCTSGSLTVSGATPAPATFNGTLDDAITFIKTGSGNWTFAPQNDYAGAVTLQGGTLQIGKSLHLSNLSVSASATDLRVGSDCALVVDTFTRGADSHSLDVKLQLGASLKFADGTAGAAVPGVTLNGHAAVLDENLALVPSPASGEIIWANAESGDWTDATKWSGNVAPGVDEALPVYIDAMGSDYTVTIAGAEVTTTNLFLANCGDGTATLLVTNGTLNVRGHTTSEAVLKMREGSRLDVVDSTLRLMDQGNAVGELSNRSSISLDYGEINVRGNSSFVTRGILATEKTGTGTSNLNTMFDFGNGTLTFDDEAIFTTAFVTNKPPSVFYHNLKPVRAGAEVKLVFRGNSRPSFSSAPYSLRVGGNYGHAVLELDGYAGTIDGWNLTRIGVDSGVGEFRVKRGHYKAGGWDFLWIGTPDSEGVTASTYFSTGRVDVASGASLYFHCGIPTELPRYYGVFVGRGTGLSGARGTSRVYGELNLAGDYTQRRGYFFVGAGPNAEGLVRQTGGTASVVVDLSQENSQTCGEMSVGVFGGRGRYVLEDGAVTTGHYVYLGGAFTNDLHRAHANSAVLDNYHDAYGALEISGGSFTSTKDIILGRDGTGVISLAGTGTVAAAAIVVSNTVGQAASGLRFTVDAARNCGRIAPATKLVFLPGAQVTVDVTAQATAANPRRVVVWNLDEAPEGIADLELTLVGAETLRTPNGLTLSADGKMLSWNISRSTLLIVR
ncbi:MAG: autotransporter-associated beta strand repeat-containing protein [Kiritimatiellia bacterium]